MAHANVSESFNRHAAAKWAAKMAFPEDRNNNGRRGQAQFAKFAAQRTSVRGALHGATDSSLRD